LLGCDKSRQPAATHGDSTGSDPPLSSRPFWPAGHLGKSGRLTACRGVGAL